jgi:hypothetical protein
LLGKFLITAALALAMAMEVLTQSAIRRSTRLRVEVPVRVTSLDRMRPFAENCVTVIVSAQGCGFRSSQALQMETPILLSGLPGGGSVTARVVNCLPLGDDGKYFLIGASLYTHGNVWGIANPPEDWRLAELNYPTAGPASTPAAVPAAFPAAFPSQAAPGSAPTLTVNKKNWPYNRFDEGGETHSGRK